MPELIDKHAAYTALKHEEETHGLSFSAEAFGKAARIIDQMPTIDAEPVRHGRWIMNNPYGIKCCSECGYGQSIGAENYCPNCGSKNEGDYGKG